jgi:lipopolysaccharide biosynthesis glycosyltransferase
LPVLTLAKLRARFWWLGSVRKNSHILALDGDTATIKVIQRTWNCRTQKYEAAVARDFAELGLKVVWQRCWCRALQKMIDAARAQAAEAGLVFDEAAFIEHQRTEETARQMRDDARD